MMTLELSGIRQVILDTLSEAGWTVSTLSVAGVKALTPLRGIGPYGAARIIEVAMKTVNERGLATSKRLQSVQRVNRVTPTTAVNPKPEPPAESERVRRIRESMEK